MRLLDLLKDSYGRLRIYDSILGYNNQGDARLLSIVHQHDRKCTLRYTVMNLKVFRSCKLCQTVARREEVESDVARKELFPRPLLLLTLQDQSCTFDGADDLVEDVE